MCSSAVPVVYLEKGCNRTSSEQGKGDMEWLLQEEWLNQLFSLGKIELKGNITKVYEFMDGMDMVNRKRLLLYGKRQLIWGYPMKVTGNRRHIKGCIFFTDTVKLWNSCHKIL